jgi:hypothetical protein
MRFDDEIAFVLHSFNHFNINLHHPAWQQNKAKAAK